MDRLADLLNLALPPCGKRGLVAHYDAQIIQFAGSHRNLHLDGQGREELRLDGFLSISGRGAPSLRTTGTVWITALRSVMPIIGDGCAGRFFEIARHDRGSDRRQGLEALRYLLRREQVFQFG